MKTFESIQAAAIARPGLAGFLHALEATRLYRSWIPRKTVTLLAPVSDRLASLEVNAWPASRIELFVLRHTLPGRLEWKHISNKRRLITLSGDLLPVPAQVSAAEWLHLVEPDIMVEGMIVHLVDTVLPASALLGRELPRETSSQSLPMRQANMAGPASAITYDASRKQLSINRHLLGKRKESKPGSLS